MLPGESKLHRTIWLVFTCLKHMIHAFNIMPREKRKEQKRFFRVMVVMLSVNYPKSMYSLLELHTALQAGIKIIPFLVSRSGMITFSYEQVKSDIVSHRIETYLNAEQWTTLQGHSVNIAQVEQNLSKLLDIVSKGFDTRHSLSELREIADSQIFSQIRL